MLHSLSAFCRENRQKGVAVATVWIDRDACMGAGTCSQIEPNVFEARSDGTWTVKEEIPYFDRRMVFDGGDGPDGYEGRARIPEVLLESVLDAAEQCPGECIFVEVGQ